MMPGWRGGADMATNLQLYISTGEQQYADKFQELLWPALERNVSFTILTALHGIPHMDASFKEKLRPYVVKYKEYIEELEKDNPYGVPIGLGNWAGSGIVVNFGTTVCFANTHFPDIIDASHAFQDHQLAVWLPSVSQLFVGGNSGRRPSQRSILW
jgi:endoglucanase